MPVKMLINRGAIHSMVRRIAKEIQEKHQNQDIVFLAILNGSFIFMADLIREFTGSNIEIDFIAVSSYGNSRISSRKVKILKDTKINLKNKHVILVEDIIDTGRTLEKLLKILQKRKPASLEVCVFLDKSEAREVDVQVDYLGLKIPNEFIVGYGLDCAGKYRNLPYIGILSEEK